MAQNALPSLQLEEKLVTSISYLRTRHTGANMTQPTHTHLRTYIRMYVCTYVRGTILHDWCTETNYLCSMWYARFSVLFLVTCMTCVSATLDFLYVLAPYGVVRFIND